MLLFVGVSLQPSFEPAQSEKTKEGSGILLIQMEQKES